MKRLTLTALATALGFGAAGSALAANGLYVGAGAGQASYDVCGELRGLGATSCDDEDTGWKVFGGYDFSENLAVEAAWVDLGEVSASAAGGAATVEVDGIVVDLKGTLPLNEAFGIFGKVGFLPAHPKNAVAALRSGAATIVFPGGEWEALRPVRKG